MIVLFRSNYSSLWNPAAIAPVGDLMASNGCMQRAASMAYHSHQLAGITGGQPQLGPQQLSQQLVGATAAQQYLTGTQAAQSPGSAYAAPQNYQPTGSQLGLAGGEYHYGMDFTAL
jgi:hypothetical protein